MPPWLFPQRSKAAPLDPTTAPKLDSAAKRRAGITTAGGIPALRPVLATPLLEAGTELPTLRQLLGQDRVTTPMRSVQVARNRVAAQSSPLERLPVANAQAAEALPLRLSSATAAGADPQLAFSHPK